MIIPAPFEMEWTKLLSEMDQAYERSAVRSGFVCRACEDNCCRTRFYHHTLIEWHYLRSGLAALPSADRESTEARAREACRQAADLERRNEAVRVMCPLNEQARCILYTHRPMICRLHGIPHALRRPDGRVMNGPGCDDFYTQCGQTAASPLDRTPLYTAMADLERRLREQLTFYRKIRLTVAEMIINEIY